MGVGTIGGTGIIDGVTKVAMLPGTLTWGTKKLELVSIPNPPSMCFSFVHCVSICFPLILEHEPLSASSRRTEGILRVGARRHARRNPRMHFPQHKVRVKLCLSFRVSQSI
jgi:hypothetical protein